MQKSGISFCVFIALGFAIGCSQTNTSVSNTSSQIMKLSAASTDTSSLLAAVPATSRIDGYRDFKFGMTASEVLVVAKKTCRSVSMETGPYAVIGSRCYENGNDSENLVLWIWDLPGKAGQRVLVYVSKEAALYSRENLRVLDQAVSGEYKKVSQMSEAKLKQLEEDEKGLPVGNLYAGGQVALVVERNLNPTTPLMLYIRYCAPEKVAEMHEKPFKS